MICFSLAFLAILGGSLADTNWWETFGSTQITEDQYEEYVANDTTANCVLLAEDCVEDEGRRVDGTCNNLANPIKGARLTPQARLLPDVYDTGFTPRKAASGNDLPLNRRVRTSLLAEGSVPSTRFTHLVTNFWNFMVLDSTSTQDTRNYVLVRPYCCLPAGLEDEMCAPNEVPSDDPVHRFSEVRCMNMTKPTSYQNQGCVNRDTGYDRLNEATPALDLSFLYGSRESVIQGFRLNTSGMLIYDEDENGVIWPPPITENPHNTCKLNEEPEETRCNLTPVPESNTLLGPSLFTMWTWRYHNKIAQQLAELNPSWDDDKLFATAKDINIAAISQIYYYELCATMYGSDNLISENIISADSGFRDLYNETLSPHVTYEYLYALRWVHTIQETQIKMFDTDGNYLKQIPTVNLTFRTGYLAVDDNIVSLTQGSFRQPCGEHDYIADYNLAELALGAWQRSLDVLTNDQAKSRWLGLQPYINYREYCTGESYSSWEDLERDIAPERINMLKNVYENVTDIDLIAGIWLENLMEGTFVPPTVYCLTTKQLFYNVLSDRHWYERADRPNAFSAAQLAEIRKASVSSLMCEVGDGVTQIQPQAFLISGVGNEITSCDNIPRINISAWKYTPEEPRNNREEPQNNRDEPRNNREEPRNNREEPRNNREEPRNNRNRNMS